MQSIIDECKAKGTQWEDPEFPADRKSLGKTFPCSWLRPSQYLPDGIKPIIFDQPRPDDIIQGKLGDCWFLSSLSVMAEQPQRIARLFRDHVPNDVGVVCVTFVLDGAIARVLIDDRIPCDPADKRPLFSRNKGGEQWVQFLEKAYAKAYGSYARIESGTPGDALADLTGAPFETLKTADLGAGGVWKELVSHSKRGALIAAGVPKFSDRDLEREVGLIEGHAYAVLHIHAHQGEEHLVQLRNPWGKVEWKGAWSDKDSHWTPELKAELGVKVADDGTFWMAASDFVKFFDCVTILLVDDSWAWSSCQFEASSQATLLSLDVPSQTELFLTVHQRRGRDTVSVRLCVVREESKAPVGGTTEVFVQAETLSSRKLALDSGRFLVLLEVFSDHTRYLPLPFAISCYSRQKDVKLASASGQSKPSFAFVLPEFAAKYGLCTACGNPLSGSFVAVSGKKWHCACFVCGACGMPLDGPFIVKDGSFVCQKCVKAGKEPSKKPATSKPAPAAAAAPKHTATKAKPTEATGKKKAAVAPGTSAKQATPIKKPISTGVPKKPVASTHKTTVVPPSSKVKAKAKSKAEGNDGEMMLPVVSDTVQDSHSSKSQAGANK